MIKKILKILGIGLIIFIIAGAVYQFVATKLDEKKYPPIGKMIDIGGYKLHMIDVGVEHAQNIPTIVLEAGIGGTALNWSFVYPEIAKFARVIVYDRAGYGWSDVSPLSRTSENIIHELHTMLHHAQIPGPYILVGHSFGGMNVRLFAAHYPNEIAGLILVDAFNEKLLTKMPQLLTNFKHRVLIKLLLSCIGIPRIASYLKKQSVNPKIVMDQSHKQTTKYCTTLLQQLEWMMVSCDQVRHSHALPVDIPITIISAGKPIIVPGNPFGSYSQQEAQEINKTWIVLQHDLVQKFPQCKHIIAEQSGHDVPHEQPEIIVETVREMLISIE